MPQSQTLGEWIKATYGDQGGLAEALEPQVAKNTVSSWKTGRNGIPPEYQRQIRKLGFKGPWPAEEAKAPTAGLYSTSDNFTLDGAFVEMKNQVHFNASSHYTAQTFLADVLIMEARGKWRHSAGQIVYEEISTRVVNDAGQMGPWQAQKNGVDEVRNVTESSFQFYADNKQIDPALLARTQGLEAGWKTYNRLGD